MKKLSLWILAAVLLCGTSLVTTSCETMMKIGVDVVDGVKMQGIWQVTEAPANSVGFRTGAEWTFDNNLLYSATTGEKGKWGIADSMVSFTPNGKSEFEVGKLVTIEKNHMEISLSGSNGVVKFKKIGKIDLNN